MSDPSEQTTGAVLASEQDRKIRDSIEDLLDEFAGVASTAIIADEIWNRIVGPALDAPGSVTQWGYRFGGSGAIDCVGTEKRARSEALRAIEMTGSRVALVRREVGPWIEVTS